MMENINFLCLSFQRALLFNIPKGVISISFNILSSKNAELIVFSDHELDEDEKSYLYDAVGEVNGDLLSDISFMINFFVSDSLPNDLSKLGNFVFALAEKE